MAEHVRERVNPDRLENLGEAARGDEEAENPERNGNRMSAPALRPWWRQPHRLLDATLALSLVILLALGGWLIFDRGRGHAATSNLTAGEVPNPALELKREAGQLWVAGERLAALEKWEAAHLLSPGNADIAESFARAQVAVAADFLRANEPDRALSHLESAYRLMPEESAVLHEYQALVAYIAGRDAVAAHDWDRVLDALTPLYRLDSEYLDTRALLEKAHAAKQQERAVRRAMSERAASQAYVAPPGKRVASLLRPTEISSEPGQTRPPAVGLLSPDRNKHIVVSINAQRMYVYENGRLIWDWVASTGEAARPTVPGRYRIQSKFENARSNVWSLWMPYWQGIYWAGSVENGIHGQVTFDSGGRLWEGYLGTRITYGCVMISDEHAAMLYQWTDIGTPVSIHWDWDPAWIPDENGDPL